MNEKFLPSKQGKFSPCDILDPDMFLMQHDIERVMVP